METDKWYNGYIRDTKGRPFVFWKDDGSEYVTYHTVRNPHIVRDVMDESIEHSTRHGYYKTFRGIENGKLNYALYTLNDKLGNIYKTECANAEYRIHEGRSETLLIMIIDSLCSGLYVMTKNNVELFASYIVSHEDDRERLWTFAKECVDNYSSIHRMMCKFRKYEEPMAENSNRRVYAYYSHFRNLENGNITQERNIIRL